MRKQSLAQRAFTLATSTRRRSYKSLTDQSAFALTDLTHDPLSLRMTAHQTPSTRRQARRPRPGPLQASVPPGVTSGPHTVPDTLYWDTTAPDPPGLTKEALALSPTEKRALDAFQDAGQRRRRERVREELGHFCTETSFTPLVRIYNASSWLRRLGWLLVVFSMFSWLTVQCYWLLDKYFSYPMEVKIGMVAARELPFPSVTVCNLNPIRRKQAEDLPGFKPLGRYTDLIKNDDPLYKKYTDNKFTADSVKEAEWLELEWAIFSDLGVESGARHRRSVDSSERRGHLRNVSFNKWDHLDNITNYYQVGGVGGGEETRSVQYRVAMAYATIAAQLPSVVVKTSGHALREFLLNCYFDGFQCSPMNFTYFHNHKYGNCYTFNTWEKQPETLFTKFSGPEHGLTLEFNLQQDDYVPALAAEAGVRVVVHPKGSAVFPEDDGVSIQPGHSTSVGIAMDTISRLGSPHGSCDDFSQEHDEYVQQLNLTYRKLSCLKSCYQAIVQRHCNCSLPMYFVADRFTVCNMTIGSVDLCASRLPTSVPREYDTCDKLCPQPCSEVHYTMTVSSAAWPSDAYEDYMKANAKQSNYLLMDGEIEDNNFAKLNVYFMDLIYTKIEQQKAYESQNLISDIGGQLGLWLGLSAITLGELCGLIFSLFRSLTARGPGGEGGEGGGSTTMVTPFSTALQHDSLKHVRPGNKASGEA
ncbi:hypothetical protein ACOMHN_058429 [Nucella lapillus]